MKTANKRSFHQRYLPLLRFFRGREPTVLFGLLVVVLAIWGLIELTDEVREGSTDALDRWAARSSRDANDAANPIGPTWMEEAGRDLTALGGIAVMLIAIATAAGFLVINRA